MKGIVSLSAAAIGATAALAAVSPIQKRASTPAVTVKGNAFFAGNERFYIRGVDYQPGGSSKVADPIADAEGCKRDIAEFTKLGINTVRVYSVDNSANHDECMKALADAGIYLVLDLNTPLYSLNREDPAPSYNDVYLQNVFATVDVFVAYENTLAFFCGNEVVNDGPTSKNAPYVKAVNRDIRQYMGERGHRKVPVGYSAADISTNRLEMAEYMNCGTDDERSDFFAFNDYSWCDPSDFHQSQWDDKVKNFTGYGIPLFLSEYGCKTNTRKWEEVELLYSLNMTIVYSGGLVYEFSDEESGYGLCEISGDRVTERPDFATLQSTFKNTPNPTGDGGYNKTGGASGCPTKNAPNWDVEGDSLPAIPEPAKKYMKEGAGKGAGLQGPGSQNAGTQSSGTATPGSGKSSGTPTGTSSSATGSSSAKGAAASLRVPVFGFAPCLGGLFMVALTFLGATLL